MAPRASVKIDLFIISFIHLFMYLFSFTYLLNNMHAKSLQSCPTLCNIMDCSLSGSSVHGILQEYSSGSSCPLPGIFPTQGSNLYILCFLHWQVASLPLVPPRKPYTEHQLSSRHFCKCHREKDAQKSTPYWRVIP